MKTQNKAENINSDNFAKSNIGIFDKIFRIFGGTNNIFVDDIVMNIYDFIRNEKIIKYQRDL